MQEKQILNIEQGILNLEVSQILNIEQGILNVEVGKSKS
jgi:hypothetical protein